MTIYASPSTTAPSNAETSVSITSGVLKHIVLSISSGSLSQLGQKTALLLSASITLQKTKHGKQKRKHIIMNLFYYQFKYLFIYPKALHKFQLVVDSLKRFTSSS